MAEQNLQHIFNTLQRIETKIDSNCEHFESFAREHAVKISHLEGKIAAVDKEVSKIKDGHAFLASKFADIVVKIIIAIALGWLGLNQVTTVASPIVQSTPVEQTTAQSK